MTEPTSLIAYQLAEREIVADEVGWSFGLTWIPVRCIAESAEDPRKASSHDRATLQERILEVKRALLPILVPQPGLEQTESCHAI
jgi:hypothetical protein